VHCTVSQHHVASRDFSARCRMAWRRAAHQHNNVAMHGSSPRRNVARSISNTWHRVVSRGDVAWSLCTRWRRAVYQHNKTTWCSPFDLQSISRHRSHYMTLIGIIFNNATHRVPHFKQLISFRDVLVERGAQLLFNTRHWSESSPAPTAATAERLVDIIGHFQYFCNHFRFWNCISGHLRP